MALTGPDVYDTGDGTPSFLRGRLGTNYGYGYPGCRQWLGKCICPGPTEWFLVQGFSWWYMLMAFVNQSQHILIQYGNKGVESTLCEFMKYFGSNQYGLPLDMPQKTG
jgi:hypothetical protein